MPWLDLLAYVFGGAFLANALPLLVSGMLGRPSRTLFAKPPGEGPSSSTVNLLWGFANLVLSYLPLARVGSFDVRKTAHAASCVLGLLAIGFLAARHFGRFYGGVAPERP